MTTFIVGLVKLVAGLKQLRPAPGQMGVVKTIKVGSEKAYLNDSWSYLSFDASSTSLHDQAFLIPYVNTDKQQPGRFTSMVKEREHTKAIPRLTSPLIWGSTTT